MFLGPYGFVPDPSPMLGPPVPKPVAWRCSACDVSWKSFDRECWSCGSTAHVLEFGSMSVLEAAIAAFHGNHPPIA